MPDDILNKVIHLISRDGDGSDKDILIKQTVKEVAQNKYARFYRARQYEADPSLAQFFYSVYKIIYPLQVFFKDPVRDARIRQVTLEAFLDKPTMALAKRLSAPEIAARREISGDDFANELEDDLAALQSGFDNPKITAADKCYNMIASMKQFVFFHFGSMLRKFDPDYKDGDFTSPLKFVPADINLMMPDLAAFLSVLPAQEKMEDWKTVFEILKYCKGGTDVISLTQWNSLLVSLNDVRQSRILELLGRIATSNPILEFKAIVPHETLSASWLDQKTAEVREVLNGIAENQRNARINVLEQEVFGSLATTRLTFYTVDKGRLLRDKGLVEYDYAPALNHLLTFIEEFMAKEIYELCDLILIRGQWTNIPASRDMSEAFHEILDIPKEIRELDESLAEDGSNGPRIKGAMLRVDRDKSQARYINSIITGINEVALNSINNAVTALIKMGKHFKALLDDSERKSFELIMNWKELVAVTRTPITPRLAAVYKRVNYFVQLMGLEIRQDEEEEVEE
jgi:hypothetical protein